MKKLLSLLLAVALMGSLALPAAAVDDASTRLAKVTQKVKTALDLDTDAYGDFQGECYEEELAPTWNLRWKDGPDEASLYVEALEDGTVTSYRVFGNDDGYYWRDGLPTFPRETDESAERQVAEDFLKRVLAENETVELKESRGIDSLTSTNCYFSGKILLNGVPSPLNCSITVENGKVKIFNRDAAAAMFLGDVPSPKASAEQAKAAADLREKLSMKLEYVKPDGDNSRAVLRYVPEDDLHTFYVDANTGEVLDITELEEGMNYIGIGKNEYSTDAAAPTASAGGADRGLSSAEQAGVEKLAGVLSAEELDASLRAVEAYGLKGYTLSSTSYLMEENMAQPIEGAAYREDEPQKTGRPVCRLSYVLTDGDDSYTRTFSVDARTGKLLQLYASTPWGRDAVLTEAQAREKAEAFLEYLAPDRTLAFYKANNKASSKAPYYSFTFAREVDGTPFAANYYSISIDNVDGFVCGLNYAWDDMISFDSTDGVITPEAARNAWADTYDVTLEYRMVPQDLTAKDPVQARLISLGMKRYYGLRLTYGLSRDGYCQGIDAKTGQAVEPAKSSYNVKIAYTDISSHSAKADIEKLARYGIGFTSSEFRPGKIMTQWELVCLLASVQGERLDPAAVSEKDRDYVYNTAYNMGALTRAERSDESAVTFGTLVKMLLNAAGYGPAAKLTDIYTSNYTDQASIPAADLGYAAIAQALGMTKGAYGAARNATRADAASMLCRILERT